jgi:hypothetical protein
LDAPINTSSISTVSRPATPSGSIEAPPRHVLLRRLPFVVLGWLVFALIQWVLSRISSRSFDESWDIAVGLSTAVCWTALTLGIWAWVGVLDRWKRPRLVTLIGHVAAVLVAGRLPVDVRHQSKVDRGEVARRAARVLAGARPPSDRS